MTENLSIKRVYEPYLAGDGQRVLVDRVWPRGLHKEKLGDVVWLKEIAPSTELRQWFAHRTERWTEFRKRYWAELDRTPEPVAKLHNLMKMGSVILLYSARDIEHNQALALRDYLLARR
jgi:uncharacterized protein YeaO (DUF488 family)